MIADMRVSEVPLHAISWEYRYARASGDSIQPVRDGISVLAYLDPNVDPVCLDDLPVGERIPLSAKYGPPPEVLDGLGLIEIPAYVTTVVDPVDGVQLRFYVVQLRFVA
jgi:hypothetical protein